jgi:hypothetical protein
MVLISKKKRGRTIRMTVGVEKKYLATHSAAPGLVSKFLIVYFNVDVDH